jgi:hypothetical protein
MRTAGTIQLETTPEKIAQYIEEMSRDPTADEMAAGRNLQLQFLKEFGDFDDATFRSGFWIGSSPNGDFIGFMFTREDGTETRVHLRFEMMLALWKSIRFAMAISAERTRAACQTAGQA